MNYTHSPMYRVDNKEVCSLFNSIIIETNAYATRRSCGSWSSINIDSNCLT